MNAPSCLTRVIANRFLGAILVAIPAGAFAESDTVTAVVFGGSANYPPFEWSDEDGRARGFLVDLKNAIAERGGRRPVHELTSWPDGLAALDAGRVDIVPMFHSDSRARKYLFTEPFYYVMHAIYGRPGTQGITGPVSLDGMRVAVVDAGYAGSRLMTVAPAVRLVPRPSIEAALSAVIQDEADVALAARPTASRFLDQGGLELQPLGPPLWPRRYVFAVNRDRPELLDWVERNLRTVVAEGRYHDIYDDWKRELEWSRPAVSDYVRRAAVVLAPLAVLGILGYLWSWQLHRRVTSATRKLEDELALRLDAEQKLRYRARHEALTDLPTRSEFVRRSGRELAARDVGGAAALIATVRLVDLDRIISAFGYETGEQLLSEFGARLREMDFAVVGDFGRGVFGVLVVDEVEPRRVLKKLTAPVDLGQIELDPHFTMGIVRYPEHGHSVEELVRKSETALADASSRNRAWVEYTASMEPEPEDLIIVRDFRRLDLEGVFPVFQPLVDLESMSVVGSEALIRWHHPEKGLICPERFIPLLERAGVVYRVTHFMIREAARVARDLYDRGRAMPVSVNVSAVDLIEGDLRALILDTLKEFDLEPELLRLEMTETSVIEDPERVGRVVANLGEYGVRCGIDDFGVGYSSLAYLSEFSVYEVKIDRSFVTDMRSNHRHGTIVRSIIALAHELDLGVVAEGVEDWQTVADLKREGCDRAQGFIFCKPVDAENLATVMDRGFGDEPD